MNCEQIKKTLTAYLDDELRAEKQQQVETHLKYCNLCRIELNALRKTNHLLDRWGEVQPGKDIAGEVMARIDKERGEGHALQRVWQFFDLRKFQLARAAAIILILGALLLGMKETYSPPPDFTSAAIDPTMQELFQIPRIPIKAIPDEEIQPRDSLIYPAVELIKVFKQNYRPLDDRSNYVFHVYYDHRNGMVQVIGYSAAPRPRLIIRRR